ncbi:MAG: hypothetical protein Q7R81_03030 [Candidatus Peregrinibacteria bacterium]|nr:hypothetical protein [Candidatus Peregrinibacteria bacterium]
MSSLQSDVKQFAVFGLLSAMAFGTLAGASVSFAQYRGPEEFEEENYYEEDDGEMDEYFDGAGADEFDYQGDGGEDGEGTDEASPAMSLPPGATIPPEFRQQQSSLGTGMRTTSSGLPPLCLIPEVSGQMRPSSDREECLRLAGQRPGGVPDPILPEQTPPEPMPQHPAPWTQDDAAFRERMKERFSRQQQFENTIVMTARTIIAVLEGRFERDPAASALVTQAAEDVEAYIRSKEEAGTSGQWGEGDAQVLRQVMQARLNTLSTVDPNPAHSAGPDISAQLQRLGTMIYTGIPSVIALFNERGLLTEEQTAQAMGSVSQALSLFTVVSDSPSPTPEDIQQIFAVFQEMRTWMEPIIVPAMQADPALAQAVEGFVGSASQGAAHDSAPSPAFNSVPGQGILLESFDRPMSEPFMSNSPPEYEEFDEEMEVFPEEQFEGDFEIE